MSFNKQGCFNLGSTLPATLTTTLVLQLLISVTLERQPLAWVRSQEALCSQNLPKPGDPGQSRRGGRESSPTDVDQIHIPSKSREGRLGELRPEPLRNKGTREKCPRSWGKGHVKCSKHFYPCQQEVGHHKKPLGINKEKQGRETRPAQQIGPHKKNCQPDTAPKGCVVSVWRLLDWETKRKSTIFGGSSPYSETPPLFHTSHKVQFASWQDAKRSRRQLVNACPLL